MIGFGGDQVSLPNKMPPGKEPSQARGMKLKTPSQMAFHQNIPSNFGQDRMKGMQTVIPYLLSGAGTLGKCSLGSEENFAS